MMSNINEHTPMPYREKVAWLSLAAMLLAFIPYFAITASSPAAAMHMPGLRQLWLFFVAVVVQVVVLAAGHAYLRLTLRDEATAPPDERDREIERRAITWAYYALVAGTVLAAVILPFLASGWTIVNAALFVIVAAEIVHYAGMAISYRRQS